MQMPTFDKLIVPTLKALEQLGGSGSIEEIANSVIQALNLPDTITSQSHNPEKSSQTEVEYRLAWARTYLKKYGLLDNSERGIWSFTCKYQPGQSIDSNEVVQAVRGEDALAKQQKKKQQNQKLDEGVSATIAEEVEAGWKESLTYFSVRSSRNDLI